MTDEDFEKQKARVLPVWEKWVEFLHFDHHYIHINWEREHAGPSNHWLASTQADWHYRQMFVFFYLPKIVECDDDQLDNLVLHEMAHMLVAPARTDDTDREKLELATENVARAIEEAYAAGVAEGKKEVTGEVPTIVE